MRQSSRKLFVKTEIQASTIATLVAIVGRLLPAGPFARPRKGDVVVVGAETPLSEISALLEEGAKVYRLFAKGWGQVRGFSWSYARAYPGRGQSPIRLLGRGRIHRQTLGMAIDVVRRLHGDGRMVIPVEMPRERGPSEFSDTLVEESLHERTKLAIMESGIMPLSMDPLGNVQRIVGVRLSGRKKQGTGQKAKPLGRLATGQTVYNFAGRCPANLFQPVRVALALTSAKEGQDEVISETDLGDFRLYGETALVNLRPGEKARIAVPLGRTYRVPVVVPRRRPRNTTSFTLVLRRIGDAYCIVDAHWGWITPPVPWDPRATFESQEFWQSHALALPVQN